MTNKLSKQYNYAEMSVLNVKSIKVTNGKNKDNFHLQVSLKGGGMIHFVNSRVALYVIQPGNWGEHVIQPGNWMRARDAVWELEGCT